MQTFGLTLRRTPLHDRYLARLRRTFTLISAFPKSLFKIWNFGVVNAKILPCRLEKSPKIGIFSVY
jgi:hypothetical protein